MEEILKKMDEQTQLITDKFTKVDENQKAFEKRLTEIEAIAAPRRAAFSLPGVDEQKEQFSFVRAINAISTGDWSGAGFEKEVFENMKKKVAAAGSDTAGGYLVPSQYIAQIIELLREKSTIMQLGATVMDNLTVSPVEIPKQTGGATAYWIGENEAITPSDLTFGMIKLTPRSVAAMMKFSNRILRMSNPSIEAIARRDMAQTLALAIDLAGYIGDGESNEPLGIINTAGINSVALGTDGGYANFDTLMNIAYEVEISHALYGSLSFAFHPAIRKRLAQLKVAQYSTDTGGEYIIMPMDSAQLRSYIGYNYTTTTQLPTNLVKGGSSDCTPIIFGNWQEMIIAGWAGLEIMASQETSTAFERNQTWVRIIQEVDFAVRQPKAFCVCLDARI